MTHANSMVALDGLDISQREREIMTALTCSIMPMTDREIVQALGYQDMNSVRPRVTEMIQAGLLCEVDTVTCRTSGKPVRLVTIVNKVAASLTVAPVNSPQANAGATPPNHRPTVREKSSPMVRPAPMTQGGLFR